MHYCIHKVHYCQWFINPWFVALSNQINFVCSKLHLDVLKLNFLSLPSWSDEFNKTFYKQTKEKNIESEMRECTFKFIMTIILMLISLVT